MARGNSIHGLRSLWIKCKTRKTMKKRWEWSKRHKDMNKHNFNHVVKIESISKKTRSYFCILCAWLSKNRKHKTTQVLFFKFPHDHCSPPRFAAAWLHTVITPCQKTHISIPHFNISFENEDERKTNFARTEPTKVSQKLCNYQLCEKAKLSIFQSSIWSERIWKQDQSIVMRGKIRKRWEHGYIPGITGVRAWLSQTWTRRER